MKWLGIFLFAFFLGINGSPISKTEVVKHDVYLTACGTGPGYWCQNLTTARDCNALKHCIQTVWEHTKLETDNDDICTICKDMVTQARDQLESNETQEELKEVFEGSCRLIPVKVVAKECIKMADEFIPELVETLASQMNPQMVCATAGLCNSVRIDQMLATLQPQREVQVEPATGPYAKFGKDCSGCHTISEIIEKKISATSDDQILSRMVKACGYLGSLSSGCQEIVITNFATIVNHLREHFRAREVCDLAGMCKAKHHEHAQLEVEVMPRSESGKRHKDEPCDLCEQLVRHLRDVLVSNTTQDEFKDVLKGLCRQTKSFKDQCLSLVNEYYATIYTFLVDELNPRSVCDLAGICHEDIRADVDGPLWLELPARKLLPAQPMSLHEALAIVTQEEHLAGVDEAKSYPRHKLTGQNEGQNYKHFKHEKLTGQDEAKSFKREKHIGQDEGQNYKHFKQEKLIGRDEAESFRHETLIGQDEGESYKQEKLIGQDEAQSYASFARVPLTKVGSNIRVFDAGDVLPMLPIERTFPQSLIGGNKETCEFCQYFLHYVQKEITSPTTEAEIKEMVDEACDHLPKVISGQCRSFVATYGDAFVALLAQEMDPSQVCPQLGLCPARKLLVVGKEKDSPTCPLCLYAMEQLDTMIKDDKTEAGIRSALEKVCAVLPKRMVAECDVLVDKYSEELVDMLIADFTPQEICVYLKMCAPKQRPTANPQIEKDTEIMTNEIPQLPETRLMPQTLVEGDELVQRVSSGVHDDTKCVICEFIMTQLDDMLKNNATDEEIKQAVHNVCNFLPQSVAKECNDFVYEYADLVIQLLIQTLDPKAVCQQLSLCPSSKDKKMPSPAPSSIVEGSEATCKLCTVVVEAVDKLLEDGSVEKDIDNVLGKVCDLVSTKDAKQCHEMINEYGPSIALLVAQFADSHEVCSELKLCGGGARVRLLGARKCTWGPSYWCQSEFHALACKATKHCQDKVWQGEKPSRKN